MTKTPKTGLAERMRRYMAQTGGSFTPADIADAIGVPPGPERERVRHTLSDFFERGEIFRISVKQNRRQNSPHPGPLPGGEGGTTKYRYKHEWKTKRPGKKKAKLLKAMYVSSSFATSDIIRLAELPDSGFADKVVRLLLKKGVLEVIARRPGARGGVESIFRIADRQRFRIEEMD